MDYLSAALFLFAGIGVINGLLLGVYLIVHKNRLPHTIYFGGLLLAISIRIGKSIISYYDDEVDRLILQIGLSACVFIGPFFYLFLRTKLRQETKLSAQDLLGLSLLGAFVLVVGIAYAYRSHFYLWNDYFIHFIYGFWAFFTLLGMYEARSVLQKAVRNFVQLTHAERYLLGVMLGMLFISCTYFFAMYIKGFTYLWGSLIFSGVFYYLMIAEWRARTEGRKRKLTKAATSDLTGAAMIKELDQIVYTKKLHQNAKLKLADLAAASGWTAHQLSHLLNEYYPHGFAHYINEKRVEEAKRLMLEADHLSLEGIGYEAGFNAKSTFYATFRKHTGCTPAQYKKQAQKQSVEKR